ncbi:MAG: winged helix-turn-helix domain-containing protein, partial [Spirochaetales bacterium]|nr:winged helix-turn-helix domain-containing protein [Spirochaetales bacterium]
ANYKNLKAGIEENTVYLERFFRNLILGENNELKNRYTHIDYDEYIKKFGVNEKKSVQNLPVNLPVNDTAKITQKITVKITVNQQKIIDVIKENPFVTQEELSSIVGIARLNINKNMKKMQEQGIIKRVGADKNGHWEILK